MKAPFGLAAIAADRVVMRFAQARAAGRAQRDRKTESRQRLALAPRSWSMALWLSVAAACGCGSENAPMVVYPTDASEVAPRHELVAVRAAESDSIARIRSDGPIQMGDSLAISGELPASENEGGSVQVKIRKRNAKGQLVIYGNAGATIAREENGRLTYRLVVNAPKKPGRYEVSVTSGGGNRVVGQGEIDVR